MVNDPTADGRRMDTAGEVRRLDDRRTHVLPSLLQCDLGRLADEVAFAAHVGLQGVHWDVMDGRFVPNITYGPSVVAACRADSPLFFDVHLMIAEPEKHLDAFLDAGSDCITIHLEATADPAPLLAKIRAAGRLAGLAIKPATPADRLAPFFDKIDLALAMSVEPGAGGQTFLPVALDKLTWLREHAPAGLRLEVDGGVNRATAADSVAAGARWLVTGSAIFRAPDRRAAVLDLQRIVNA